MKKIILSLTLLLLSCTEDTKEKLVVYQSPTCGCCSGWVANMESNGMNVEAIKTNDMYTTKVNAGIDMAMIPYNFKFCDYLYELVQEGEVNESRIDDAVRRILALKYRLGLFDSSYDHYGEYPEFGSKSFQNLALEASLESITLLKNDNTLPLTKNSKVLITGPNGTGKELVAHWLHEKSDRSKSSLIEVNCAAIPSELIESELFGHVKGSFTGANKDRAGKFEAANNGTIFLDEIGDMSLSAQAKVLRALQENKIQRVGSDRDIKVNVRIIAATNKNLKKEIKEGRFREDLYHRLAVILIKNHMQ